MRSAILHAGFEFPARRITVNLAPAHLPKAEAHFDLPIAIGILLASKQLHCSNIASYEFAGELGLNGVLRPVRTLLPFAMATAHSGRSLVCAQENAEQAALCSPLMVFGAHHLLEICAHLAEQQSLPLCERTIPPVEPAEGHDMCHILGQSLGKRALEIAAAGEHSLLLQGPPGCGKTMLARALPKLLPPLTESEALETWRSLPYEEALSAPGDNDLFGVRTTTVLLLR